MAKTKEAYEREILDVIKEDKLFTIEMIFSFYNGISRSQFYEINLNKSDTLLKGLNDNKNLTKHSLLKKWLYSDNPTLQIALYKSICTDEERQHLNQSHVDLTSKGNEINAPTTAVNINFAEPETEPEPEDEDN